MRIVFMGTPDFAVPGLNVLAPHTVGVFTKPPQPKGRGQQLSKSPVQECAEGLGIPVFTPASLKSLEVLDTLSKLAPDIIVVIAYGQILPKEVLDFPRFGCVNVHASLLPRWRGAAPIQRAIMAGDEQTGITLMQMDEGLDTGKIISMQSIAITKNMNALILHDKLAKLGAEMLKADLPRLIKGKIRSSNQPAEGITYASKIIRTDEDIRWDRPALEIFNQIRGLSPFPKARFVHNKLELKITKAEVIQTASVHICGAIISPEPVIACGKDALRLLELQRTGGKLMLASEFIKGYQFKVGEVLSWIG